MKKIYTLIFSLFLSTLVYSQSYVLEITSNVPSKGQYEILKSSSFGNQGITNVVSTSFLANQVNLGCEPVDSVITGKVAFIDRGTCAFTVKALNAQAKGAAAVIILNTTNGAFAGPGGADAAVTVPTFMLSFANSAKVKADLLKGTVNVTIRALACGENKFIPANAIFGLNKGEGDFDGGLNGWTVSNPAHISWRLSPSIRGTFTNATVASASACNGYVGASSDSLDNAGICLAPCLMSLTSPNISLAGQKVNNLAVAFTQNVREFNSQYFVLASYDNGVTYPDTISFNEDVVTNTDTRTNQFIQIPLCKAPKTATQIRIKFLYNGNYYYWAIDDFFLVNNPNNNADPQINAFLAQAPSYISPKGQGGRMTFLADIKNNGGSSSTNTVLKAEIINAAGVSIYSQTNNYGTVGCNTTIENKVFANSTTMPTAAGNYNIRYTINADTNVNKSNDTLLVPFVISDSTFATISREPSTNRFLSGVSANISATFWNNNVGNAFSVGNYYFVTKGTGKALGNITFGIDTAAKPNMAGIVTLDLYKVKPDANGNGNIDPDERTLLGTATDVITRETPNIRNLVWRLKDANDKAIMLEDNTGYAVVLHTEPLDPSGSRVEPLSYGPAPTEFFVYYIATFLGFEALEIPYFHSLIASGNSNLPDARSFSPYWGGVPSSGLYSKNHFLEMNVVDVGTANIEYDSKLEFAVYPNPTRDEVNVNLTNQLVGTEDITISFVNMVGQEVLSKLYKTTSEIGTINISSLASGNYFIVLKTNKGFATQRLNVVK